MGNWHAVEGSDSQLDPEIAQIAGSSGHIIRTYEDKKTGEQVTALVLYGLANSVSPMSLKFVIRLLASGRPRRRSMNVSPSRLNDLRPISFGGFHQEHAWNSQSEETEVCYTFLHNGEWLPEVASRWKSFRYHPAIFKIQLQRRSSGLALQGGLTESLLRHLVQEIDSRISQNKTQVATVPTSKQ